MIETIHWVTLVLLKKELTSEKGVKAGNGGQLGSEVVESEEEMRRR